MEETEEGHSNQADYIPELGSDWLEIQIKKCDDVKLGSFDNYFPRKVDDRPNTAKSTRIPMTASYFGRNETNGDASRLLVAATVNRNSDNNTVKSVDHGHAMYSLLLSSFASELSQHQQRVFTALLFYTKVHGAANKANTTMLPLCVPEEPKVLRKLFTDGTKSIREVLPRPTIQILGTSGNLPVPFGKPETAGSTCGPSLQCCHSDPPWIFTTGKETHSVMCRGFQRCYSG
ncbi:unnamed protein product [Cylindrotheca closterium]|uniref:Uncharacterized protein n=1 Tax=Cylindrotheca closterium TaxID=2856 RepID=A0AAD2JHF5_9STRA|nr:unnamed protein product [Cylindrotheca closterium]